MDLLACILAPGFESIFSTTQRGPGTRTIQTGLSVRDMRPNLFIIQFSPGLERRDDYRPSRNSNRHRTRCCRLERLNGPRSLAIWYIECDARHIF